VTADAVRRMLGLSDRGAVRDLFGLLLAGDGLGALDALRRQYDHGVDPQGVLRQLMELVHGVTLAKLGAVPDPAQSAEERGAGADWAARLSFPVLHRLWQLTLRGHDEVAGAVLPIEAAEMALLRIVHASQLPDPGELARRMAEGGPAPTPALAAPVQAPPARPEAPAGFAALVAALEDKGHHAVASRLRHGARLVRYAPPELVLSSARPLPPDFARDLSDALARAFERPWKLLMEDAPGEETLNEQAKSAEAAERQAVLDSPLVRAAFQAFPDAELVNWKEQA
jgi:DNA polymerase-3 subunit gamma/tau